MNKDLYEIKQIDSKSNNHINQLKNKVQKN